MERVKSQSRLTSAATHKLTTADACAFTREVDKLHPNNPAKNTGQDSANNCGYCELPYYYCTWGTVAGAGCD